MTLQCTQKTPIDSIKKLLNLISEFGKEARYEVNIQKSMVFMYTNNELSERETRKKNPITIATRKIKYRGINLTKEVKDLYLENCRALKKETEKDTNKWKHMYCAHGLEELTSFKCPYCPKQSTISMKFLFKYQYHISQNKNKYSKN